MDDFEICSEGDDDEADTELAEALIRLCPHLSPDTDRPVGSAITEPTKSAFH